MKRVTKLLYLRDDQYVGYNNLVKKKNAMHQKFRYFDQESLQKMQDLDILGSQGNFFPDIPLRVSRKGISSFISLAPLIINLKVVSSQFLSLTDLLNAQVFIFVKRRRLLLSIRTKISCFQTSK